MSPSATRLHKFKKKYAKENPLEGMDEAVIANGAIIPQTATPLGRKRIRVNATPSGKGLSRQMFGDNIEVSGGHFTQADTVINVNNNRADPFELLQRRVAPSAFHNSAQRVDPPRCHPGTRVEILDSIYNWIIISEHREEWLLWLNGAAGAGKSAIIQSIAERCVLAAITIASFFFFRADPTRNTTAPLIATLAYQLIQLIPETSSDILITIKHNPLIFDQSLESQLQLLLIQPLLRLPKHLQRLFVVLIDGLDECDGRNNQSSLIKLFGTISHGRNSPIIFVVSSRREPQIEAAFVGRQISNMLRTLPLDNLDIEKTSEDIRHFLADRFMDIKETHLRRHLLPKNWPQVSAVEEIVTMSSGQFIYASVVISYVSSPRGNPAHLLEIVRGIRLRDPSSQNPFAHLDALYQHIFSQVEPLNQVLDILAYILITKEFYTSDIEDIFLLEHGELQICLADLTAVIECNSERNDIKFLHASLPDFLLDKTRSEIFHIDIEEYTSKLLCMFLNRAPPRFDPLLRAHGLGILILQKDYRIWAIKDLLASGPKASEQLRQALMTFSVKFNKNNSTEFLLVNMIAILEYVKNLNFEDRAKAYHHVLNMFAIKLANSWSSLPMNDKDRVRDIPDLWRWISQILRKKL